MAATADRKLHLNYTGGIIEQLSSQLYSGPVPAIVELIANSWDACASHVEIQIPLDVAIGADSEIVVSDDGEGMSFEDCDAKYLLVGRRRREHDSEWVCEDTRRVMGRKGIGKLAVFGIGRLLNIRSIKDGWATEFNLDYDDITAGRGYMGGPYEITPVVDGPVDDEVNNGTTVVLRRLGLQRRINGEAFVRSLSRRFAILSSGFVVSVNGVLLQRADIDYQFRFPESGWQEEEVAGRTIKWWVGFTKETIKDDDARGVVVMARGKLVQAPWFFDLSGGAYGQHGMQYMAGEVQADFLDDEADLIATNRQSVSWEHPTADPVREWGEKKVRELLRTWAERRQSTTIDRLKASDKYLPLVERFSEPIRTELLSAIDKVAGITTIEDDRIDEIVSFLIAAYQNEYFFDTIREINKALESDQPHVDVLVLLKDWDIIEAVATARIIKGRVSVINIFDRMIRERVPEKAPGREDIQTYIEDHPWLIDPGFVPLTREKTLQRLLEDEFGIETDEDDPEKGKIPDFAALAFGDKVVVIEVKRPGRRATREMWRQIEDYVDFLRRYFDRESDSEKMRQVTGYLIASGFNPNTKALIDSGMTRGIYLLDWGVMAHRARNLHAEFFEIMIDRAPEDDPNIQRLREVDAEFQTSEE